MSVAVLWAVKFHCDASMTCDRNPALPESKINLQRLSFVAGLQAAQEAEKAKAEAQKAAVKKAAEAKKAAEKTAADAKRAAASTKAAAGKALPSSVSKPGLPASDSGRGLAGAAAGAAAAVGGLTSSFQDAASSGANRHAAISVDECNVVR